MLRVLVVDDEENAIHMIEDLLSEFEDIIIVGKFTNPLIALSFVERESIDLAILDIDMPLMDGIQLAEEILQIHEQEQIEIVFVTAYSKYAVKAFELYALDYLLKPVQKERIKKTIERLPPHHRLNQSSQCLFIQCFGSFEVYNHENKNKPFNWKTNKAKELCAYLVHHRECSFESDQLIEVLWPNDDYEKARINFYTCISFLRKTFKNEGYNNVIQKNKNGYQFKYPNVECDVEKFIKTTESVDKVTSETITIVDEAMKMYSGHYFEREAYLWAQNTQETIRRKFLNLLREMKVYYCEHKDFEKALDSLYTIINFDPNNEQDYQDIMNIYLLTGRRIEAINLFQELRQNLMNEYNIEPSKELSQLFNKIIEQTH